MMVPLSCDVRAAPADPFPQTPRERGHVPDSIGVDEVAEQLDGCGLPLPRLHATFSAIGDIVNPNLGSESSVAKKQAYGSETGVGGCKHRAGTLLRG